jgi:nitrogen-specific signal transduction histidine kinase
MLFIFVVIGLWTISLAIIIARPHNKNLKLLSLFAFVCGISGIVGMIPPNVERLSIFFNTSIDNIYLVRRVISTIPYYIGPYISLCYGMSCYSEKAKPRLLYIILFIPVIVSYLVLPFKTEQLNNESPKIFLFLSIWVVPYLLATNLLIILKVFKTKDKTKRIYWLLTSIVSVPFILFSMISNYILRSFDILISGLFPYLILIQLILFIFFATKYGVFGVKINLENYNFSAMKIFEHISESIIVLDENLKVIQTNQNFKNNFTSSKYDELENLISSSKLNKYKEDIINTINTKSNKNIQINIDDKFYDLEIVTIMKKTSFNGVFIIIKDMTEYYKNIELIKENQIQLIEKEKLSAFSHLISGMAHNLKTPLMTSLGGIEILKMQTKKLDKYKDDEIVQKIITKQTKYEERIQHSISNVSKTIKFIQNQAEATDDLTFSIKRIIKEVETFLSYELPKNNCILKVNIDIYDSNISIDNSITQVLTNLIINSMQSYSNIENKDDKNIITLKIYSENNNIIFIVKDFGCGIPEDIQTNIFKKMTTTKGNEGSGLGLYITNIIVKAKLNGTIYFESNPKGTTFFIKIPFRKDLK